MTAVFVIRHPQTTWNVEGRYQGGLEAPLSEAGREQLEQAAAVFDGEKLDAVYSSPLGRARELAEEIAARTSCVLELDPRLSEIGLGPWEGLYRAEIESRFPDLYRDWYLAPDTVTFPAGESLADVTSRAQAALSDAVSSHPDGLIVFVTHSVVVQVLVAEALALPLRHIHRIHVSNGGITTLCAAQSPGRVLEVNSTSHLYPSPVAAAVAQNCVSWKERRMTV